MCMFKKNFFSIWFHNLHNHLAILLATKAYATQWKYKITLSMTLLSYENDLTWDLYGNCRTIQMKNKKNI